MTAWVLSWGKLVKSFENIWIQHVWSADSLKRKWIVYSRVNLSSCKYFAWWEYSVANTGRHVWIKGDFILNIKWTTNAWSYMATKRLSFFQRRSYLCIKGVVLLVCYYLLFFRMFFLQICELPEKTAHQVELVWLAWLHHLVDFIL